MEAKEKEAFLKMNTHPMTCDKWTEHCRDKQGNKNLLESGDRYVCECGLYEQMKSGKIKLIHYDPETHKPTNF